MAFSMLNSRASDLSAVSSFSCLMFGEAILSTIRNLCFTLIFSLRGKKKASPFFGVHSSPGASSLADFSCGIGGDMYSQLLSMVMPLSEYVKLITKTRTVSPPGYPNRRRLVLTDDIKQLMRRVLALMPDPEANNRCYFKLKADNIFVDLLSGEPFLHGASWTANYDGNLAKMNYASVEEMFRQIIFSGTVASLPADFQQLLVLMKTNGDTASYAIQHHCSLVWRVDKKEFFTRIYDFSNDILQKWDYMSYADVMTSLNFPANWDTLIQQNPYLDMFYRGSTYYPGGGPNAGKDVLRFKRNAYIHCLQHAWDMATMQRIYDQADMGEILETALPLVLHNFQLELDKRGLLRLTMLESLFH